MVVNTILAKIQAINLDSILTWIHRLSLVGFLLTTLFIFISDELLKWVMFSVLLLYVFLGITWINHARKNGMNEDRVSKQVAYIVLGTVALMIVIAILFKVMEALAI